LGDFHYSGSFGIPDSSVGSPEITMQKINSEAISIEANQFYENDPARIGARGNTIDGDGKATSITKDGRLMLAS